MADEERKSAKGAPRRRKVQKVEPAAIVGIGVGAASLAALEQLFAALDASLDAAFVVAVRQAEGLAVGKVLKALKRPTSLPVVIAADGDRIESGRVYLCGPDDLITLSDGHIVVRPAEQPVGHRGTIDTMLMSLAEHAQDRAVAVILNGLGSDGTAGVTATKKFGGLSIAESTGSESEAVAQGAATPAGIVDLLLPVEQVPSQIRLYVDGLGTVGVSETETSEQARRQLSVIATILRNVTGNDFHGYKTNTFLRRVQRRMQVVQATDIEDYVARLRQDRDEVYHLFQDLLIGVTQFFRDPAEFENLQRELPRLFKGKNRNDTFRVWVLGCATGEEAYSIAMLLAEHLRTVDTPPHIQIFATDLDSRALGVARAGRYSGAIAEHVGPERLARWFVKEGDTYCVVKELREMCIFSPHNLVKDAPFSRIDILSCRNLLIYLNADLQDRVIPIFHFSLRPGGILFLGASENVTRHQKLFAPVDRRNRLYRRLDTPTRILPEFPLTPRTGRHVPPPDGTPAQPRTAPLAASIGRRATLISERYAPAYVIVDAAHEVLHFSGRTGRFLEPSAGTASLNLVNLVHRDLRLDLRAALHRVTEDKSRVERSAIPFAANGRSALVNLIAEPVGEDGELTAIMVLFQDAGPAPESLGRSLPGEGTDEHVERLESELRLTRDRLQATIEELESTNEELKSSNEEYQSVNEELQSANEELETSKEELQSVNEELQTVNTELANRVSELGRANSDLRNLLESTQIATIFLDSELRVRSFTPAATEVLHLVETDVGRSIDHVASRLVYPGLTDDVRTVLAKLGAVERELATKDGQAHYIARVLPYRSIDNFIAGAVVTFVDVTGAVRAETALRQSEERFRRIVESARDYAIIIADPDGRITDWTPGAAAVFGWTAEEAVGQHTAVTFTPEDQAAGEPQKEIATARRDGFASDVRWHQRKDGRRVFIEGSMAALQGDGGSARALIKIGQDVTDRRRAEEHQRMLLAELQHRVRNTLSVVRSVARRTAQNSASVEELASHLEGRLDAFARVQALVTRKPDAGIDLASMIEDELLAHATREGEHLSIEGPDVSLTPKPAETVSLAIHELTTNAVKYGALSSEKGRIAVRWGIEDGRMRLSWTESGLSARLEGPDREGFGLELLRRVVPYELQAESEVEFRPSGLRFTMSMPLEGNVRSPEGGSAD